MGNAESWADNLRYGRDWRSPVEVSKEKYHPRFNLCVFLDDAHRVAGWRNCACSVSTGIA